MKGRPRVSCPPRRAARDSCKNDFIVTGVNIAGAATQANLIGFNSLYNTPAGNGLCAGTAPKVLFAYNVGPESSTRTSRCPWMERKITFNENDGQAVLLFTSSLKWQPAGTAASSQHWQARTTTITGRSSVKLALTRGTSTTPFIDYDADVAYVTTSDNVVHKFSGVFLGTPTEVKTAGSGP